MSLFGGFAVPFDRLGHVFRHAVPVFIAHAQIVLRVGVSLFGGFAVPFDRLRVVLLHPLPVFIAHAQIVLRGGVTLLGGLAVPSDRLDKVLLHAQTVFTAHAHIVLRLGVSLLGSPAEPLDRLRVVLFRAVPEITAIAQSVLRLGDPLFGSLTVPLGRLREVYLHAVTAVVTFCQIALRIGISLLGSPAEPPDRSDQILLHAQTVFAAHAHIVLRLGVPLFGGFAEPLGRLRVVLCRAVPEITAIAQIVLRGSVPLFGGFAEPLDRLRVVLCYAVPEIKAAAQIVLRIDVSPLGSFAEPPDRFAVVLLHAVPPIIADAQVALRLGISLLGSPAEPLDRLVIVFCRAFAEVIAFAQTELRCGVAAFGFFAKLRYGSDVFVLKIVRRGEDPPVKVVLGAILPVDLRELISHHRRDRQLRFETPAVFQRIGGRRQRGELVDRLRGEIVDIQRFAHLDHAEDSSACDQVRVGPQSFGGLEFSLRLAPFAVRHQEIGGGEIESQHIDGKGVDHLLRFRFVEMRQHQDIKRQDRLVRGVFPVKRLQEFERLFRLVLLIEERPGAFENDFFMRPRLFGSRLGAAGSPGFYRRFEFEGAFFGDAEDLSFLFQRKPFLRGDASVFVTLGQELAVLLLDTADLFIGAGAAHIGFAVEAAGAGRLAADRAVDGVGDQDIAAADMALHHFFGFIGVGDEGGAARDMVGLLIADDVAGDHVLVADIHALLLLAGGRGRDRLAEIEPAALTEICRRRLNGMTPRTLLLLRDRRPAFRTKFDSGRKLLTAFRTLYHLDLMIFHPAHRFLSRNPEKSGQPPARETTMRLKPQGGGHTLL